MLLDLSQMNGSASGLSLRASAVSMTKFPSVRNTLPDANARRRPRGYEIRPAYHMAQTFRAGLADMTLRWLFMTVDQTRRVCAG